MSFRAWSASEPAIEVHARQYELDTITDIDGALCPQSANQWQGSHGTKRKPRIDFTPLITCKCFQ